MIKKYILLVAVILGLFCLFNQNANAASKCTDGTPKVIRGCWITNNLSKGYKTKGYESVTITKSRINGEEHCIFTDKGRKVCMSDQAVTAVSRAKYKTIKKNYFEVISRHNFTFASMTAFVKLIHKNSKEYISIRNKGDKQKVALMHRTSKKYIDKLNHYYL
ncbi:hypothetical protein [Apilactobacillus xinyiensis]|uniref:hypothetical protein n=1 Tax=Apilactobacillus xinyiensis TaxID=2841032 RepID=UPI001C7D852C|nr:hypothetical protein [Apilactobacillus xinyiensis]MCL0319477.1 hypothetical protein [Apilactobacillus xinyiensis]